MKLPPRLIVMDGVLHGRAIRSRALVREADLHTFDRLNRYNGLREPPVQARVPRNMRTQPRRHSMRHHFENATYRVSSAVGVIHNLLHAPLGLRVHTA